MSAYAITPETYAAWRLIESKNGTNHYERDWAEFARRQEELGLLIADIDQSPSVDKLVIFFKLLMELDRSVHESLARTLELYHSMNICVADLEARPEAYPGLRSEGAGRRAMEELRQRGAALAQMARETEEEQRQYAESDAEDVIAVLDAMIARRSGQSEQSEPSAGREKKSITYTRMLHYGT